MQLGVQKYVSDENYPYKVFNIENCILRNLNSAGYHFARRVDECSLLLYALIFMVITENTLVQISPTYYFISYYSFNRIRCLLCTLPSNFIIALTNICL